MNDLEALIAIMDDRAGPVTDDERRQLRMVMDAANGEMRKTTPIDPVRDLPRVLDGLRNLSDSRRKPPLPRRLK